MQVVVKEMAEDNFVRFDSSLFSIQESDFLNYVLNNKKFDNSIALRNTYSHGGPNNNTPEMHLFENKLALLVLVLYIVKIDDELKLREIH